MSRGSLFFVRTVDVAGNASPTLAFLRGIRFGGGSVMVWGGIFHGLKQSSKLGGSPKPEACKIVHGRIK